MPRTKSRRKVPALSVHFGRKAVTLPRAFASRAARIHADMAADLPKLVQSPEQVASLATAVGLSMMEVVSSLYAAFSASHPELKEVLSKVSASAVMRFANRKNSKKAAFALAAEEGSWVHQYITAWSHSQKTGEPMPDPMPESTPTESRCSPEPDAPASS